MRSFGLTLRGALALIILTMGAAGILLSLYTYNSYRSLAHDTHRSALEDLIRLEAADVLSDLATHQKELGYRIQREAEFREPFRQRDSASLRHWLNQEFKRYFVTARLLDLEQMRVFDAALNPVTTSLRHHPVEVERGAVACPLQRQAILDARGPARLKPSTAYCVVDGRLLSSVVVAIGGLRVQGYLQILTNPAHNLKAMAETLGMPLRIRDSSGSTLFQSDDWPQRPSPAALEVGYQLPTERGVSGLQLTMAADLAHFNQRLDVHLNRMLLSALGIIAAALTVALLLLGRASKPLQQLQRAAHEVGEGRFTAITPPVYPKEINAVTVAFNRMVDKLGAEMRERSVAEHALREAKAAAENQAEAMFREKEFSQVTLESIADGVVTTDTAHRVTYMNPMAEQMAARPAAESLGEALAEVLPAQVEEQGVSLAELLHHYQDRTAEHIGKFSALLAHEQSSPLHLEVSISAMCDRHHHGIGFVLVFHDTSEARELNQRLSHAATHDSLTGLINRYEFERRVELTLEKAQQEEKPEHYLGYIDLDQFKVVNDTCGHVAGDALLRQVTGLLQEIVRKSDTLARLGGDEFGLLLPDCDLDHAFRVSSRIRDAVRDYRFLWENNTFSIGCSIGLVGFGDPGFGLPAILSAADTACYAAKDAGGNRIQVYRPDDQELQQRHGEMRWVSRITHALEEDRFRLFCQPIMSIDGAEVLDLEVLLRILDNDGSLVPPNAFLPAAERYRLSTRIDRWVTARVLQVLATPEHRDNPLRLAINLSGSSLVDREFLHFVEDQLSHSGVDPSRLVFEVTETNAIANLPEARRLIAELKILGCRFALDDFGSGLSSFAYLKNLPVDILKIDGVFVRNIAEDPIDASMVKSINEIGHVMGMATVAEFVDNEAVLARLRDIGVDYAQGYAIARPAPLEDLLRRHSG